GIHVVAAGWRGGLRGVAFARTLLEAAGDRWPPARRRGPRARRRWGAGAAARGGVPDNAGGAGTSGRRGGRGRGGGDPGGGRRVGRAREMLRWGWRWRWGRLALITVAALLVAARSPFFRYGHWTRLVPTRPLVLIERAMGVYSPRGVRQEVRSRLVNRKTSD